MLKGAARSETSEMRKKSKQDTNSLGDVEMVIKINNENVVVEGMPPLNDCPGNETADMKSYKQDEFLGNLPNNSITTHCDDSYLSSSSEDKNPPAQLSSSKEDRKITHNKSEKLRRAQLKASMEKLKLLVPLEDSTQKYTTAALLRKVRYLIKKLEERERKNIVFKEHLQREQRYLRKRLEQILQIPREGLSSTNPSATPISQLKNKVKLPTVHSFSVVKPKLPLLLSTFQGQVKTPPILKRKQNLEPENTEIFYINSTDMKSSGMDIGVSSTYELTTTTDNYGPNCSNVSEKYCIIIDTGMVQEGVPISII
ncbi:unnamed protein product [Allacma fusca]|uniref:BHLH domain-containing protein n=1 Tax=Allacma fusca TaxID=39272 RepID=A0A8J2P7Y9_9HEXA|nr:unnamed protein product [Allacma fusca]